MDDARLGRGERQYRAQDRPDARRPRRAERDAHERGAQVARDKWQAEGGEEPQQPGDECQGEGRDPPKNHTAETTVVQRPSSPHSAVDVTFIVRTISPDRSHCSRRSSQAVPGSNGTPSTVASMEAARSSAYSPEVTSFWP